MANVNSGNTAKTRSPHQPGDTALDHLGRVRLTAIGFELQLHHCPLFSLPASN